MESDKIVSVNVLVKDDKWSVWIPDTHLSICLALMFSCAREERNVKEKITGKDNTNPCIIQRHGKERKERFVNYWGGQRP